jgi:hypothetical protein
MVAQFSMISIQSSVLPALFSKAVFLAEAEELAVPLPYSDLRKILVIGVMFIHHSIVDAL